MNDPNPTTWRAPAERVGDFALTWGESVRWDDRTERLYLVDTVARRLHWLDRAEPPLNTVELAGMPTGLVLTEGDELVICLDDGLHVVHPATGGAELLAPYPPGLHGRANDANVDGAGNLVTGTLNMQPGPGALWQYSVTSGWRRLLEGWGNANGPVFLGPRGDTTLVIADTLAQQLLAFPYDADGAAVGPARVLADYKELAGFPDGSTVDTDDGVWSCIVGRGLVARVTTDGIDRLVEVPPTNPSDVAFAGDGFDRLMMTSIAMDLGVGTGTDAGCLLAVETGFRGRPEARMKL